MPAPRSRPPRSPAPSGAPTRQQLDDLDALLQRMLALPVNQAAPAGGSAVHAADLGAEPPAPQEPAVMANAPTRPRPPREEEAALRDVPAGPPAFLATAATTPLTPPAAPERPPRVNKPKTGRS